MSERMFRYSIYAQMHKKTTRTSINFLSANVAALSYAQRQFKWIFIRLICESLLSIFTNWLLCVHVLSRPRCCKPNHNPVVGFHFVEETEKLTRDAAHTMGARAWINVDQRQMLHCWSFVEISYSPAVSRTTWILYSLLFFV